MSKRRALRIGAVATELPPATGGMQELARGLLGALGEEHEISLFTLPGRELDQPNAHIHDDLTGRPWIDLPRLRAEEPALDLWLMFNAALAPLASRLDKPSCVLVHGNDLLVPWLPCAPAWLERVRRPYAAILRNRLRARAVARALPRVTRVLAISQQTADLVIERSPATEHRLEILHPGVADVFFQQPAARADGPLHLLTVSRLSRHTRRKNVDGVLRAISLLADHLPLRYTVIGDGDDRDRLETLAGELGIAEQVDFRGRVAIDTLLEAYRQADLFVLASKATDGDIEGFGIVYSEASASGLPVLCSRAGGAVDAVQQGVNGLIIDSSTPAAIASGIESFRDQRSQFTTARIQACAERLRWSQVGQRASALLASVVDQ